MKIVNGLISALLLLAASSHGYAASTTIIPFAGDRSKGRTLEEIQQAIHSQRDKVYAVFKTHLKKNPKLAEGKVIVSFTIAPNGSVSSAHVVSSSFADGEIALGILKEFKKLRFEARNVPEVTYPNYPVAFMP